MSHKVIHQLALETAYSSKGHFKSADWIRIALSCYIFVPLFTSLIIFVFDFTKTLERILSFTGLIFSSLALSSSLSNNRDKAEETIEKHMQLGNEYLTIFKALRNLDSKPVIDEKEVDELHKKINDLDGRSSSLHINLIGRLWSKIRVGSEMDLSWITEAS
jgi:hypothetical protein